MRSCVRGSLGLFLLVAALALASAASSSASGNASCEVCTSQTNTGFCVDASAAPSGSCLLGNSSGPYNETLCSRAAWVTSAAECATLPCPTPTLPSSASFGSCLTSTGWTVDSGVCSFECSTGFTLIGDSELVCHDGVWSGSQECLAIDPAISLPLSGFTMSRVDWFLLVLMCVLAASVPIFSLLVLTGKVLPHLGEAPVNLTLWDLDSRTSRLQRSQRRRRWIVALLGTGVLALGVAALTTDGYSTATLPSEEYVVDVTFRSFSYELHIGAPFNFDRRIDYGSCGDGQLGDTTLCYLFRVSLYASFLFEVLGLFETLVSVTLLLLVLCRVRRENYWRHAMRFNLAATGALVFAALLYVACTQVVLRQMFGSRLDFELGPSWFLQLGTALLAALWNCATFHYYRPTATDDDDGEKEQKAMLQHAASPDTDGRSGGVYTAMSDENPFA